MQELPSEVWGGSRSPRVLQHLELLSAALPPLPCPQDEGERAPSETEAWGCVSLAGAVSLTHAPAQCNL